MKNRIVVVSFALVAACGGSSSTIEQRGAAPSTNAPGGATPGAGTQPGAEATYSGVYEVPVPAELAAAATYATPEIHWTVSAGTARLAYNLPKGLVGTSIRVDFTGPFDPATNRGTLTGAAGTSECTATATTVVCTETMRGLLPIDGDMERIESIARSEYAGPVAHRLEVASRFMSDPIGIIRVDLATRTAGEHETESEDETEHEDD